MSGSIRREELEAQIAQGYQRLRQLQEVGEALQQHIVSITAAIASIESVCTVLPLLKAGEHEVLFSLGSGVMLRQKVPQVDKVIIAIGAGYAVGTDPDTAKTILLKRRQNLERSMQQAHQVLAAVSREADALSTQLRALIDQLQQKGGSSGS
ncbi:prefoldin subunit alpha [archaeon]|nr:prefoldin subunit alpha [archaeon]